MLTYEQIKDGLNNAPVSFPETPARELGVRIAFEWLDAQTKASDMGASAVKNVVEVWGATYISLADVETAAWIHHGVSLVGGAVNTSKRLTRLLTARLTGIVDLDDNPRVGAEHEAYEYARDEA